jgi:predicted metal-dependent HD superfamily phosphohydrolase
VVGARDNEEKSVDVARTVLHRLGYNSGEIEKVADLIMATKMPTSPKNDLEKLICDADLDNLGREDCLQKAEAVRKEFGITESDIWWQNQLKFLQSHKYYSPVAKALRQYGLERNIEKVKEIIESRRAQNAVYAV